MQIKALRKNALAALLVVLAVPAHAGAQATGLNVSIKDQRLVVAYHAPDGVLFGSVALRAPYQVVSLDALQFDFDASIQGEGDGTGVTGEGDGTGVTGEGDGTGVSGAGDGTGISGAGDGTGITGAGDGTGVSGAGDGTGSLIPAWGYAEVLLGCGRADVIIYHDTERGLEEALVETVTVDYCARP